MRIQLRARLLATALVLAPAAYFAAMPVDSAQAQRDVSFRNFHRQLRDHGDWYYSDRWGEVWQPYDVRFRPYRRGYWVDTDDYGWYWVSDEPFGDITYHYGRWVNDPDDGWLWIPGYAWSPAWVVWRRSGNYLGWMPMPPDRRFLDGDEFGVSLQIGNLSIGFNSWNDLGGYYGYGRWYGPGYSENRFNTMWTFVPTQRFGDRDLGRYALPPKQIRNVLRRSSNATNYTVVNNFIVNHGPADVKLPRVHARDVVRQPDLVMPLDQSRKMRIKSDIPRGTGELNSAPKPTASQLDTLSSGNNPNRPGKHSRHLLDKTDAAVAPAAPTTGNVPANNAGAATDEGAKKKKDKTGEQTPSSAGAATPSGEPDKKKHDEQQSGPGVSPAAANATDQAEVKKKKPDEQQSGPTATPAGTEQGEVKKKKHDEQQGAPAANPAADNAAPTDQAEKKKKHEKPMPADAGSPPQQGTDTGTKSDQATSTTPSTTTDDQKAKKKKKHPDEPAVTPTPQQ